MIGVSCKTSFALPKVAVTKTLSLAPVMTAQCLKSTKENDKVLARLQVLMLYAVRPLTDIIEKLNSGESEIDSDEVGYAVESDITLIGNASSLMFVLRRQKILEEYNRDLLSFVQDREDEFTKAAPQLFGAQFPKDAADHLEQVVALCRAKSSASNRIFGRLHHSNSQASNPMLQGNDQSHTPGPRQATASQRQPRLSNDNQPCM